jgi:hypothetical protein
MASSTLRAIGGVSRAGPAIERHGAPPAIGSELSLRERLTLQVIARAKLPLAEERAELEDSLLAFCCTCSRLLVAHRVESLRCEGSDAIGAKRTCRELRERVDLTKMTPIGH